MKKVKLSSKLNLKKEQISKLNDVKGGGDAKSCSERTDCTMLEPCWVSATDCPLKTCPINTCAC